MAPDPERRTQLLRGVLDTCLLALLAIQPTHAYDLVVRLEEQGLAGVGYGTVYPLVGRLRRQGLLDEHIEPSPTGPPRKVFSTSTAGLVALSQWSRAWLETTQSVSALLTATGAVSPTEVSNA